MSTQYNPMTPTILEFTYHPKTQSYTLIFEANGYSNKEISFFSTDVLYQDITNKNFKYIFKKPALKKDKEGSFKTIVKICSAPPHSHTDPTPFTPTFIYHGDGGLDALSFGPEEIKVKPKIKFSEAKEKRNEEIIAKA